VTILALECSGRVLSAALESEGRREEITVDEGFRHIETLFPALDRLFSAVGVGRGDLELVGCSAGPGSFTALRIGMAAAKGLARGAGCPFKAVRSMEVLARGRESIEGIVAPLMDARKGRVYAAAFRGGERITPDRDIPLTEFLEGLPQEEPVMVTGPDAPHLVDGIHRTGMTVDPDAAAGRGSALLELAREGFLAAGGDPPDTGPLYLRKSEAEELRDAGAAGAESER
jgi:tRNA threonylcarbamoyladenosine biosynthesis protein TsaB